MTMKKKTEFPDNLHRCGTTGNGYMSSLRHQAEVRGRLGFESEFPWRCTKVKIRVNSNQKLKIVESCGPHLGMSTEKGFHTRHAAVETKLAKNYFTTATKNQKENSRSVSSHSLSLSLPSFSVSVSVSFSLSLSLSLSVLLWHAVSLCPANAVDPAL